MAEDCEGPGLLRVPAPEQLEALGPRRALYFVSVTPRETPAAEAHWAGQHNRALGLRPSLELEPIKTLKMGPLLGMVSSFVGTCCFVRATISEQSQWQRCAGQGSTIAR